jgi:hypothetical protein
MHAAQLVGQLQKWCAGLHAAVFAGFQSSTSSTSSTRLSAAQHLCILRACSTSQLLSARTHNLISFAAVCIACCQAGFHQQQPLTDQEWQLLPVLMAGRLMQSTLIGTYTISRVRLLLCCNATAH